MCVLGRRIGAEDDWISDWSLCDLPRLLGPLHPLEFLEEVSIVVMV